MKIGPNNRNQQQGYSLPLVSIIIPTYNRGWTLAKAVSSVFEDSYSPIECIIVDDGSTDDTSEVLEHLKNKCPKDIELRYIRKENGGANSARNLGLVECKGYLICFLDADDYLINSSIKERATVLIDNPDVDLCYGLSSTRGGDGKEIGKMNLPWPGADEARITKYLFHTNSPMMRRSLCAKTGPWREDDLQGQEHEYFARLKFFSKKIKFIDKELSVYVKHENDHIFNKSIEFSLALFRVLLYIKALILYTEYDKKCERQHLALEFKHVAKLLIHLKDYSNASAALQESMTLNFGMIIFIKWFIVEFMNMFKKLSSTPNQEVKP